MSDVQKKCWAEFEAEAPWLNYSHRALLEIACTVRARFSSGEKVGIQALGLLRLCLSSMGLSPVDASKISWAPAEEPDDILD